MQVYKIILANEQFQDDLIELAHSFHAESPYKHIQLDKAKIETSVRQLLHSSQDRVCLLLVVDNKAVGLFVGYISDFPFSDDKIAAELTWYVLPEYRKGTGPIQLRKAFEFWAEHVAKARFAQVVSVESAVSPKVCRHYEKAGYELKEYVFLKEFV